MVFLEIASPMKPMAPSVTKSTSSAIIFASSCPSCFAQASQKDCGSLRTASSSVLVCAFRLKLVMLSSNSNDQLLSAGVLDTGVCQREAQTRASLQSAKHKTQRVERSDEEVRTAAHFRESLVAARYGNRLLHPAVPAPITAQSFRGWNP